MSRTLTKNTNNYLRIGAGTLAAQLNGAAFVSGFARVKLASLTTTKYDNCLINIRNTISDNLWVSLHDGTAARLVVFARAGGGETHAERISTAALSVGVWQSVGFVVDYAGDTITPYVNGAASNGGAALFTGSAMLSNGSSNEYIGASATVTTARQINGDVAELALWTRAVSAEEFAAMHAGLAPLEVHAGRPAVYYGLGRLGLVDPINGRTLTVGGSVATAEHPPLLWRQPRLFVARAMPIGPNLVEGPYTVAARQFHAAGAAIGQTRLAGAAAGQCWLAGAAAGEVSV